MASPFTNRLLAGAAGLVASRVASRTLRRAAPRLAGGPIVGPIVFFLASRYALPRVRRLTRDWTASRLERRADVALPPAREAIEPYTGGTRSTGAGRRV